MDYREEAELIDSLREAYQNIYEAEYHIQQAKKEQDNLSKQDPDGNDRKIQGRKKAWQRLADRESKIPRNKEEEKSWAKAKRKEPKKTKEEKLKDQKPGKESAKIRGMSRHLKKEYGSPNEAAKDPKVAKKVDGIYNKMNKSNDTGKSTSVEDQKATNDYVAKKTGNKPKRIRDDKPQSLSDRQKADDKSAADRKPALQKLRLDLKKK